MTVRAARQIRRAVLQLLFPGKPFHWLRHTCIALCLLFVVNLLVILVPNIRDIFGITGQTSHRKQRRCACSLSGLGGLGAEPEQRSASLHISFSWKLRVNFCPPATSQ